MSSYLTKKDLDLKECKLKYETDHLRLTWKGDNSDSVTLVVRKDSATGLINAGKKMYSIEPLGNGLHAII